MLETAELDPEAYNRINALFKKLSDTINLMDDNLTADSDRLRGLHGETQDQAMTFSKYENEIKDLKEALKVLHLSYLHNIHNFVNENRAYCLEVGECREELLRSGEELSQATDICNAEMRLVKDTLDDRIQKKVELSNRQHEVELEKLRLSHSVELEEVKVNMQMQIGEAENERIKTLDKFEMQIKMIHDLQGTCAELTDYINKLKEEKLLLIDEINNGEIEYSSILNKFQKLKIQKQQDITDLQRELQSSKLKAASYDDMLSEHENLKISLSEAKQALSVQQLQIESYEKQMLPLDEDISDQEPESVSIRSSNTELQENKLEDLHEYINELHRELKSQKEKNNNLLEENNKLKEKLKKTRNYQSQSNELVETKARLVELQRNKEADILDLKKELDMSRKTVEDLIKECDELRANMGEKGIIITALTNDKQQMEERINSLIVKDENSAKLIAMLRANKKDLKANEEESLKEKQQLRKRLSSMTLKNKHNVELVEKLSDKNAELYSQNESANKKFLDYIGKIEELTKEIAQLRKALGEDQGMKGIIAKLFDEKYELEAECNNLNEKINVLMDQVSELQTNNSSNPSREMNVPLAAAAPAPVIPVMPPPDSDGESESSDGDHINRILRERALRKEKRKAAYDENRSNSGLLDCDESEEENGADGEASD